MGETRKFLIGMFAVFASSSLCAEVLPVLPAPDQIAILPKPPGFDSSLRMQLDRITVPAPAVQSRTGAAPIAVLSIDPERLRKPEPMDASKKIVGPEKSAPPPGPLTLRIADKELQLVWVGEVQELSRSVRHVTMQLLNVPEGYARFSIERAEIVGTIVTPGAVYRIVPNGTGAQVVFGASATEPAYPHFKFARQLPDSSAGSALERRHIQLERLSEIQPEIASSNEARHYFDIHGGNLGKVSGQVDPGKVIAVVELLSELTNVPVDLQVQIKSVDPYDRGQRIAFHQLVRGIPYFALNEIVTDTSGKVVSVQTQFVDASEAEKVTVSQEEAQQFAEKAIVDQAKAGPGSIELTQPAELYYYPDSSTRRLTPYYTLSLRTQRPDGLWMVRIDATNGNARIFGRPQDRGRQSAAPESSGLR